MNKEELALVLAEHQKWYYNRSEGKRANLSGANLSRANLSGANLSGADLDNGGKIADSDRPIFQLGGIGSGFRFFTAYLTIDGIRLRTGCFFGSVDEFCVKLKSTHGEDIHAQEYEAALILIETHFRLWPAKKGLAVDAGKEVA